MYSTNVISKVIIASLFTTALAGCASTSKRKVEFSNTSFPPYTLTKTAVKVLEENQGKLLTPEVRKNWAPTLPIGYEYTSSHTRKEWESCPSRITKIENGAYYISRLDCKGNITHKDVIRISNGMSYENRNDEILNDTGKCSFVLGEVCTIKSAFGDKKYTTKYVDGAWVTLMQHPLVSELYIRIYGEDGIFLYRSEYKFRTGQKAEYSRNTKVNSLVESVNQ